LQVRPQPSLALDDEGNFGGVEKSANVSPQDADLSSSASAATSSIVWLIPVVVVLAVSAGICAGFVVYSRRNKGRNSQSSSTVCPF
jgi:hypothetical protein